MRRPTTVVDMHLLRAVFKVRDITLPVYMTFKALLLTVQHGAVSLLVLPC